ncbi:MAG: pro-sigmaK processing inhibitor BofA family protein [Oscillospiraceae bacterium]|nr:pro-sigmaK processing inhibitor BofA family protein [Oscillospiraceae bacterium]
MSNTAAYFLIFSVFSSLIFVQIAIKSEKPIRKAIISSFWGILTLIFVNAVSFLTNAWLPVSLLSIGITMVLGIPGVTMLLIMNILFNT